MGLAAQLGEGFGQKRRHVLRRGAGEQGAGEEGGHGTVREQAHRVLDAGLGAKSEFRTLKSLDVHGLSPLAPARNAGPRRPRSDVLHCGFRSEPRRNDDGDLFEGGSR
ncbi:MAG: hypothetical protein B7Z41_07410 [Rhizobiales bacterium 12-66-7]|nr:MAG: hypothetical protein B7Z41_07410 [Rhizobiales bacterium 12-66-7]